MSRVKVARLIDTYDFTGVGDDLEDRWTRTEDRWSLRDLAEYFNRQILDATVKATESNPFDGEIDSLYESLTSDDVTSGARHQARVRLEQHGVDVQSLENDFVSYQAIRTYLRDHREVSPPDNSHSPESHRKTKQTTIQQLSSRLTTVSTDALNELTAAGRLTLGEFDVTVAVRVHCTDCDTRVSVTELLTRGGCQCETE